MYGLFSDFLVLERQLEAIDVLNPYKYLPNRKDFL